MRTCISILCICVFHKYLKPVGFDSSMAGNFVSLIWSVGFALAFLNDIAEASINIRKAKENP